jgi:integrase
VNQALAAFKGTLKAAWRLGLIDDSDYNRVIDVAGVKNQVPPRGRAASLGEVRALLDACHDGTPLGARDAALLSLAYGTGLRRAEIVALDWSDYNSETGELLVRRGKGAKARTAYVAGGAADALEAWLTVRGEGEGPLFRPYNRGAIWRRNDSRLRRCATYSLSESNRRDCRRSRRMI